MKVIYILDVFPKISETFILNEILEIQRKGITIEVFAFSRANEDKIHPSVKEINYLYYLPRKNFCKLVYAHLYWFFKKPHTYAKALLFALRPSNEISKLFLKNLYDVILISGRDADHIHAHFGRVSSNLALLTHLLTGVDFTFTTHRYDIFESPSRNYKIKSTLAKRHIAISEYNKKYIVERFGVDEEKISVIHSGIDFEQTFPPVKHNGEAIIISVARLDKQKGLDNLIKACYKLKKQGIIFKCLILGEGPERRKLEKLIEELNLVDEVKLLGNKTQSEVFESLATAAIKVLSSRSEGIPVSLMEAMALRVPVIGPNVNGVSELIENGKCGFLVLPNDIDSLVEKIKVLLSNDELRKGFAEAAYNKVLKDFNLEIETDKLVKIWKR